jgi:hypothetical protein
MIRFSRQMLVLPLAACLLLVPILASPATVAHEVEHSHHKAASHSSPLCAWFCGAGQEHEIADSVFAPTIVFLAFLNVEPNERVDDSESILPLSRGPPPSRFL